KIFPAWLQKSRSKNILPFEVDPPMVPLVMKPRMSRLARSILTSFSNEKLLAFAESRKKNSEEFLTLLKFLLPDFEYSPMAIKETPYKFALRFNNSQDTIRAFEILKNTGLWPVSWPDLPPVIKERSGVALALRHTTIYLPVHHQLKILKTFRRQLKISTEVEIHWDNVSHEKWDEYCQRIAHFNLLQHWGYGDAKKLVASTPFRRGIIYFQKQPIAVVQAFIKKIGFVSLIRVNRGPLFFNPSVSPKIRAAVYQTLRKQMGTGIFSFLFIIPELEDCLENRFILSKAGFFRFRGTHSETAWVDLRLDADTLRGNLKSKWRNLLKNAEASGLRYTISTNKEDFSWLEKQHVQDMQSKQFSGVPLEMQRQISSMVLIAYLEDRPVAGVMIAHHLDSATYLVGTNSAEGRKCNANNFLLWNALLEMKNRGCKSFDLGGLGVHLTPHIAHFKRGVGGQEFHYPGEYFAW
ncbi:MAG: GNAT family N-acetyltransferase, partial [Bdellovibrionota bacterium]